MQFRETSKPHCQGGQRRGDCDGVACSIEKQSSHTVNEDNDAVIVVMLLSVVQCRTKIPALVKDDDHDDCDGGGNDYDGGCRVEQASFGQRGVSSILGIITSAAQLQVSWNRS